MSNSDPIHSAAAEAVLQLKVRNHSGVMSHVCGLLARRAFNVEGILCLPMEDRRFSRIWLLMREDQRLNQAIQQIQKLQDVLEIERHGVERQVFAELEALFNPPAGEVLAE